MKQLDRHSLLSKPHAKQGNNAATLKKKQMMKESIYPIRLSFEFQDCSFQHTRTQGIQKSSAYFENILGDELYPIMLLLGSFCKRINGKHIKIYLRPKVRIMVDY